MEGAHILNGHSCSAPSQQIEMNGFFTRRGKNTDKDPDMIRLYVKIQWNQIPF